MWGLTHNVHNKHKPIFKYNITNPDLSLSFSASLSFFLFFFFLPLSWCLAFLNSLSKFLHFSHLRRTLLPQVLVRLWLEPTSQLSSWTHILAHLDFDFDFMVVVAAIAIAENHLLVLIVRVGMSVRVRLKSVVRWQDASAGTITWVSR